MVESSFSVVVPASTANLGPGFDSIGLALNLYMTVDVSPSEDWEVTYKDDGFEDLPTGEDNLIVKTITDIAERTRAYCTCIAAYRSVGYSAR